MSDCCRSWCSFGAGVLDHRTQSEPVQPLVLQWLESWWLFMMYTLVLTWPGLPSLDTARPHDQTPPAAGGLEHNYFVDIKHKLKTWLDNYSSFIPEPSLNFCQQWSLSDGHRQSLKFVLGPMQMICKSMKCFKLDVTEHSDSGAMVQAWRW